MIAIYGDNYCTIDDLKAYMHLDPSDTAFDAALNTAINSASREIENYCSRQFNNDYDATNVQQPATTRVYKPTAVRLVLVDDFYTTTDLVIKHRTITGTLSDPWTANYYYELEPVNGVVNGVPGWPYRRLILPYWRYLWNISRLEITAHWGWAAVPEAVKQACLVVAAQNYKLGTAPLGVSGTQLGGGHGLPSMRVHDMPQAAEILEPYRAPHPMVG